jgi:hypothetical protein
MLKQLFDAYQPFIVHGFAPQEGVYQSALDLFRSSKIELFNLLGNNSASGEIRNYHELLEAIARLKTKSANSLDIQALRKDYSELFTKYLISSQALDTSGDFNVQFDVLPRTEMSRTLVSPVTIPYSRILQGFTWRSYLNTVISMSRGNGSQHNQSKHIHGHNYDTFTVFAKAGSQTRVYFFPPDYYLRFKTRLVSSAPGIVLLIPDKQTLHEGLLAEAFVYDDVKPGDIVYTPPLWFHCFHHNSEYMNIANGEFFHDFLPDRLARVKPELFADDWTQIAKHMQSLQHMRH